MLLEKADKPQEIIVASQDKQYRKEACTVFMNLSKTLTDSSVRAGHSPP